MFHALRRFILIIILPKSFAHFFLILNIFTESNWFLCLNLSFSVFDGDVPSEIVLLRQQLKIMNLKAFLEKIVCSY